VSIEEYILTKVEHLVLCFLISTPILFFLSSQTTKLGAHPLSAAPLPLVAVMETIYLQNSNFSQSKKNNLVLSNATIHSYGGNPKDCEVVL